MIKLRHGSVLSGANVAQTLLSNLRRHTPGPLREKRVAQERHRRFAPSGAAAAQRALPFTGSRCDVASIFSRFRSSKEET